MQTTRPRLRGEEGVSLVLVIMIMGVVGIMLEESIRMTAYQNRALQILRMSQRLAGSADWVRSVAKSKAAMVVSARKSGNADLSRCLMQKNCPGQGSFTDYDLYDALGQKVSGLFHIDGRPCQGDPHHCPISIATKISFICSGNAARCAEPEAIKTRFLVRRNPLLLGNHPLLGGRKFKDITGDVTLATFMCPEGEYIRGIADNGALQCAKPRFSTGFKRCEPKTAANGVLANGLIDECITVQNLCNKSISIVTVIDTSGSMATQGKINGAKGVLKDFIGAYDNSKDEGSLVRFSTQSQVLQEITKDKNKLNSAVDSQKAEGWTNMGAGLLSGAQTLANVKGDAKLMVFVSDGMNNTGDRNVEGLAKSIKEQGIRIITVGFGSLADPVTLKRIASPGDDFLAPLNQDLPDIFKDIRQVICRP